MPELPEVESTARFLHERVSGTSITGVTVRWDRTIATHKAANFRKLLVGRKILQVGRRGKFVVFELGPDPVKLYAHMRMSGSFDVLSSSIPVETHDRVTITLSSGREVRFNDPRKFGRFYLAGAHDQIVSKLGIEPLSKEFTCEYLGRLLKGQRARIKPYLLRQDRIAGLGNIYVDEALWYAQIHPLRQACTLRAPEVALLHEGIQSVLRKAIELAGTDFGDGVVEAGGYTPLIYGRGGEECHRCAAAIERIVVGQRGTHICPRCQRKPRQVGTSKRRS